MTSIPNMDHLKTKIRNVPDFPKPGILFYDITTLLRDATGFRAAIDALSLPFQGQRIKPPYVAAYVLLDGSDIPFLHLVADIDAHEVRMGMRVEAVWKPREEGGFGIDNIEYFRPTGEPDADYDTYKHHL